MKTSPLGIRWTVPTLLVYVAAVLAVILHHEPWFDEAQAWLLARDATPVDLVTRYAAYEGTPVLWHLVLMLPAKLHAPYLTLNLVSLAVSSVGIWLVLRYAPFPFLVRVLFASSYFAAYQYAVVARSYCLLIPLMALLAITYRDRQTRPGRYIALLALVASVALHGTIIAASLGLLLAVELVRDPAVWPHGRRRPALLLAALAAFLATLAIELRIPADQYFVTPGFNLDPDHARRVLVETISTTFTGNLAVSIVVLGASLAWLWQGRSLLIFLVPAGALVGLFASKYYSPWHGGVLLLLWFFAMWVSFSAGNANPALWRRRLALAALAGTLGVQTFWTLTAAGRDLGAPYSGSQAAAAFIRKHAIDRRQLYGAGYSGMALQPYFDHNIFSNYHHGSPPSFWVWERANPLRVPATKLADSRPEYILHGIKRPRDHGLTSLPGYRRAAEFPGRLIWKDGFIEEEGYVLFQRLDLQPLT